MKSLRVSLNGETTVLSLPEFGVLGAHVSCCDRSDRDPERPEELILHLGGLDSADDHHVSWGDYPLKVGDKVEIEVLESTTGDPPEERYRFGPEDHLANLKKYLHLECEKLGWKIDENPG